jgi:hypothetical protein
MHPEDAASWQCLGKMMLRGGANYRVAVLLLFLAIAMHRQQCGQLHSGLALAASHCLWFTGWSTVSQWPYHMAGSHGWHIRRTLDRGETAVTCNQSVMTVTKWVRRGADAVRYGLQGLIIIMTVTKWSLFAWLELQRTTALTHYGD